jgi:hypothetical protein
MSCTKGQESNLNSLFISTKEGLTTLIPTVPQNRKESPGGTLDC